MTRSKINYKFILCVFIILIYSFYSYSIRACAAEQNDVEYVLNMYFAQREDEFDYVEKAYTN